MAIPKIAVPAAAGEELVAVGRATARDLSLAESILTEHVPGMLVAGTEQVALKVAKTSLTRWRFAYWGRVLYPKSAASLKLAKRLGQIHLEELRLAAGSIEHNLADALARDIAALEKTIEALTSVTGKVAASPVKVAELTRLERAALAGEISGDAGKALNQAFRRFRNAAATYDLADVQAAGKALINEIDRLPADLRRSGKFRAPSYYRERIESAVRQLKRSVPTEKATSAFVALEKAIHASEDPALLKMWKEHVRVAVSQSPHTWDRLMNTVNGMKEMDAGEAELIAEAAERVKGVLGEMMALSEPAYRDALQKSIQDAEKVAAALNLQAARKAASGAAEPVRWRVLLPQADLRAPGATGKGMRLFFDDAVLVVSDAPTPEAFVMFAAQVKAGDASTEGAVAQMVSDQLRLLGKRISVGSTEYVLRPPPDLASVTRVFVGSKVPAGTQALSGSVRLVKGPADGIALSQFAEFLLRTSGKIK